MYSSTPMAGIESVVERAARHRRRPGAARIGLEADEGEVFGGVGENLAGRADPVVTSGLGDVADGQPAGQVGRRFGVGPLLVRVGDTGTAGDRAQSGDGSLRVLTVSGTLASWAKPPRVTVCTALPLRAMLTLTIS